MVDLAVARDLDLEPFGDGVDALGADAVRAAGKFVPALAVLAAGVQRGKDHFHAGDLVDWVRIDRDAAAVVANADGPIHVNRDLDL